MFRWLKKFFTHVEVKVIELERTAELPQLTAELKDSLRTLQVHPGFHYLLQRFRMEKASLQHALHSGFNLTERELHHLQAGIHFAGWFDSELNRLTQIPRKAEREISLDERKLFDEVRSSLELIG